MLVKTNNNVGRHNGEGVVGVPPTTVWDTPVMMRTTMAITVFVGVFPDKYSFEPLKACIAYGLLIPNDFHFNPVVGGGIFVDG